MKQLHADSDQGPITFICLACCSGVSGWGLSYQLEVLQCKAEVPRVASIVVHIRCPGYRNSLLRIFCFKYKVRHQSCKMITQPLEIFLSPTLVFSPTGGGGRIQPAEGFKEGE